MVIFLSIYLAESKKPTNFVGEKLGKHQGKPRFPRVPFLCGALFLLFLRT